MNKLDTNQLDTISYLSRLDNTYELASNSHGMIEVWNLILCWSQDADQEGNELVRHVEFAVAAEGDSVQEYFKLHGFKF